MTLKPPNYSVAIVPETTDYIVTEHELGTLCDGLPSLAKDITLSATGVAIPSVVNVIAGLSEVDWSQLKGAPWVLLINGLASALAVGVVAGAGFFWFRMARVRKAMVGKIRARPRVTLSEVQTEPLNLPIR
jgi:hypothetical protein